MEIGSAAMTVTSLLRHQASVTKERAQTKSTTSFSSKTSELCNSLKDIVFLEIINIINL